MSKSEQKRLNIMNGKPMNAPREFWIVAYDMANGEFDLLEAHETENDAKGEDILAHVIEYFAFAESEARCERLAKDLKKALEVSSDLYVANKRTSRKLSDVNLALIDIKIQALVKRDHETVRMVNLIVKSINEALDRSKGEGE